MHEAYGLYNPWHHLRGRCHNLVEKPSRSSILPLMGQKDEIDAVPALCYSLTNSIPRGMQAAKAKWAYTMRCKTQAPICRHGVEILNEFPLANQ